MLGIIISEEEYEEYLRLKEKNTPMKKIETYCHRLCPMCRYVVDNAVPRQNYCDRCGQSLKG